MGSYHHNYAAFRVEVLNAGFMQAMVRAKADEIMARAEAIAPFDPTQATHYRDAFNVSSGTYGGMRRDRAYGRVENTDAAAMWIEFGTSDTPRFRTLGRAAGL